MTKMQGSTQAELLQEGGSGGHRGTDCPGSAHPCILVIKEAALAADLIRQLIFINLDRNLATHADWHDKLMHLDLK